MSTLAAQVASDLASLARARRVVLRVGERVRIDEAELAVVFVATGALARTVTQKRGGTVLIEVHGAGSWLILPEAGAPARGQATELRVLSPTELIVVPFRDVANACTTMEELATGLVRLNEEQQAQLRQRVAGLTEQNPSRRLAATILYLARQLHDHCPIRPGGRIAFSQTIIAAAAGLARQTVNRILQRWSRAGWLVLESRMICVLDAGALQRLAQNGSPPEGGRSYCCALVHPKAANRCTSCPETRSDDPPPDPVARVPLARSPAFR